jgi:hypothetical protein
MCCPFRYGLPWIEGPRHQELGNAIYLIACLKEVLPYGSIVTPRVMSPSFAQSELNCLMMVIW